MVQAGIRNIAQALKDVIATCLVKSDSRDWQDWQEWQVSGGCLSNARLFIYVTRLSIFTHQLLFIILGHFIEIHPI